MRDEHDGVMASLSETFATAARAGVPVILHTVHGWGHNDHMSAPARAAYIAMERKAAAVSVEK